MNHRMIPYFRCRLALGVAVAVATAPAAAYDGGVANESQLRAALYAISAAGDAAFFVSARSLEAVREQRVGRQIGQMKRRGAGVRCCGYAHRDRALERIRGERR